MSLTCLSIIALFFVIVESDISIVDLTNKFGFKTIAWPTNPSFNFSVANEIVVSETVVAVSKYFQTAEHSGTHIDAPLHFCKDQKAVHELTMDDLSGPGVRLDYRAEAEANPDFEITLDHLKKWEEKYGRIPDKAIVLMQFGWSQYFGDMESAFKTNNLSDSTSYHFPGLHPDAALFLARDRNVHAVGGDTPSTDYGQSSTFLSHITLLCDYHRIIIESVGDMEGLPVRDYTVYIGAIKLVNGSGTPVRLFATVGSETSGNQYNSIAMSILIVCLAVTMFQFR